VFLLTSCFFRHLLKIYLTLVCPRNDRNVLEASIAWAPRTSLTIQGKEIVTGHHVPIIVLKKIVLVR
jgi:hypothetical protein